MDILGKAPSEGSIVWQPVMQHPANRSKKIVRIGRRAVVSFEIMALSIERSSLIGTWFVHCTDANW